jgi:16S rRNA (guanine966-N2)-methyltransferase
MRISGGEQRGRTILAPKGMKTRPTSDFLRQVAFNLLGARVVGARVLDLFAGSGAFGLEALSRGAALAAFVEQDRAALRALEGNLALLGLSGRAVVLGRPVLAALPELARGEGFDLVFLDPPYRQNLEPSAIEALASGGVLRENALVLVQAFHKTPLADTFRGLRWLKTRRHGENCLILYGKESACL